MNFLTEININNFKSGLFTVSSDYYSLNFEETYIYLANKKEKVLLFTSNFNNSYNHKEIDKVTLYPYKTIEQIEQLIINHKPNYVFIESYEHLESSKDYNHNRKILLEKKDNKQLPKNISIFQEQKIILTDLKLLSSKYNINIFVYKQIMNHQIKFEKNFIYIPNLHIHFKKNKQIEIYDRKNF
jgi:hypothetical protein